MNFNDYFQDELSYLRESGHEFAKHHPQLTTFLSESNDDPDVERLLEGFAFLTGRLRQKLDDELPELTQSLISLLWPHYLRSVPSMSVAEFTPHGSLTEVARIARGSELASKQVEGTKCVFRTCYDVDLFPLSIGAVEQHNSRSHSSISMNISTKNDLELSNIGLNTLRLFLNGEVHITRSLYLWMFRYLDKVELQFGGGNTKFLDSSKVKSVGFSDREALLPYGKNSFSGYRFLQEYFSLPEKFMFIDVTGLECLKGTVQQRNFKLIFHFKRALPSEVVVKDKHIKLHCTPIVNLQEMDADPIRYDKKRTEYRIRPQSGKQDHYEVYSVNQVEGWNMKQRTKVSFVPFESFEHQVGMANKEAFYKTKVVPNISGHGLDSFISFNTHSLKTADLSTETVLMKLTCSNGKLPERLAVGEINFTTHDSSNYASFANLIKPTPSVSPQLDGSLRWQLIANMSLNYLSLTNVDVVKVLLSTYDFHSRIDRQSQRASANRLKGILDISMHPVDRVFRGFSVRGLKVVIEMDSSMFVNEGDMFLLSCVLNEFFTLYASINSSTELEVLDKATGEVYTWKSKQGKQTVI